MVAVALEFGETFVARQPDHMPEEFQGLSVVRGGFADDRTEDGRPHPAVENHGGHTEAASALDEAAVLRRHTFGVPIAVRGLVG